MEVRRIGKLRRMTVEWTVVAPGRTLMTFGRRPDRRRGWSPALYGEGREGSCHIASKVHAAFDTIDRYH